MMRRANQIAAVAQERPAIQRAAVARERPAIQRAAVGWASEEPGQLHAALF